MLADLNDKRHGTIGGYVNYRCRCPRCSDAKSAYTVNRKNERSKQLEYERYFGGFGNLLGDAIYVPGPQARGNRETSFNPKKERAEPSGMKFEKRPFNVEKARERAAGGI